LNLKLDALAPHHIFMTSAFLAVTHHDSFYGAAATMRRILANEPARGRIIPAPMLIAQTCRLANRFARELGSSSWLSGQAENLLSQLASYIAKAKTSSP